MLSVYKEFSYVISLLLAMSNRMDRGALSHIVNAFFSFYCCSCFVCIFSIILSYNLSIIQLTAIAIESNSIAVISMNY